MIVDCIEYIWEGEEIYKAKDATKKELTDFITQDSDEKITIKNIKIEKILIKKTFSIKNVKYFPF